MIVVRINKCKTLYRLPGILGITKERFQTFPLTPVRCFHCQQYLRLVVLPEVRVSVQCRVCRVKQI